MKQVILLIVGLALAFQQVFSATDEQLQAALDELVNTTNTVLTELSRQRTNYSNYFLENLAIQRLEVKLELQSKIAEANESIAKIAGSGGDLDLPFVDVSGCADNIIDDITDYSDDLFDNLETCVYDTRYGIGVNLLDAVWTEVQNLATNYQNCANVTIINCAGNDACSDVALASIQAQIHEAPNAIKSLGAAMLNTLDGFSVNCKEHYLTDFSYYTSDQLEFVSSCVNMLLRSSLASVCP